MGIESDFPALDVRGDEIGVVVMRMEEGRRTAKDRTKVLQAKVLGNGKNLLPMLVWTEDLGTIADDKHGRIGFEYLEQVVRVRDDVTRGCWPPPHEISMRHKTRGERGAAVHGREAVVVG
jgi:hypothetical protein